MNIALDEQLPGIYRVREFEATGQAGFLLAEQPDLSKGLQIYPVNDSYERSGSDFVRSGDPSVDMGDAYVNGLQGVVILHRSWIGRDIAVRCVPLEVKAPLQPPKPNLLATILQEILDCPHELNHAHVLADGLQGKPKQVLFTYQVPYTKIAEARELLAKILK